MKRNAGNSTHLLGKADGKIMITHIFSTEIIKHPNHNPKFSTDHLETISSFQSKGVIFVPLNNNLGNFEKDHFFNLHSVGTLNIAVWAEHTDLHTDIVSSWTADYTFFSSLMLCCWENGSVWLWAHGLNTQINHRNERDTGVEQHQQGTSQGFQPDITRVNMKSFIFQEQTGVRSAPSTGLASQPCGDPAVVPPCRAGSFCSSRTQLWAAKPQQPITTPRFNRSAGLQT